MINVTVEPSSGVDAATVINLIDWLVTDTPINNTTSTSFTAAGTFSGIQVSAVVTGSNLTYTNSGGFQVLTGGIVDTVEFAVNGVTVVTITNVNIDMAVFAPIIQSDLNFTDITAIETYLMSLDWNIELGDADDSSGPNALVGDGVQFNLIGDDILSGGNGADTLFAGDGDDSLFGGAQNDELYGGDDNDRLDGGSGADILDGGAGYDTAIYTNSTNRVIVSLLADTASGAQATGDTLISIENLTGSHFGDGLRGDNGINILTGNGGKDTLIGYDGSDALYGGAGRDILNGGDGADIVDGGDGVDQARYNGSSAAVQIDLLAGTATGGQAQGDTLINIENLFGSNHNDTLFGDTNNNQIFGHNGDDALAAGGGISKLYGGSGSDSFVLSDGFAFVMDFVNDVDQLDVSDYGFATLADALMNVDQVGAHARFRFDGDVLFVLNTDVDDLTDDILI